MNERDKIHKAITISVTKLRADHMVRSLRQFSYNKMSGLMNPEPTDLEANVRRVITEPLRQKGFKAIYLFQPPVFRVSLYPIDTPLDSDGMPPADVQPELVVDVPIDNPPEPSLPT